jgi:hypothetical protein
MGPTLKVSYVADVTELRAANRSALASTETTAAGMAASHKKTEASYFSMAGAGSRAAAQLEGSHSKIASSLTAIGRSSTVAIAGVVAVGAAVEGTKRSVTTLAELANETRTLHNVTGLSVKSASAYAAVAKTQEIPVKALNQAFGTFSKNIRAVELAHTGATKAAHTQELALRQLGLPMASITKAHGDLNKLLPEVIERFERLPKNLDKAGIGMALFGRGWQTLVPLMHSGALGLKEQLDVAQKMGATLGGSAQQLKEFAKQEEESKYATLGLQLAIGQYLAPALTDVIHWLAGAAHELKEGVKWLEAHEAAAKAAGYAIATILGGAITVFAYSKAKKFVEATQDMIGGIKALALKFGLIPSAAEGAAAKTALAQDALAKDVEAADVKIGTANAAAGKTFLKMLGPIAAVVLAIEGLNKILPKGERPENLLGGNQPGESEKEGEVWAKKHGGFGGAPGTNQRTLDTGGGIMGYFMAHGYTAAQAAGIVGNLQQESSFRAGMVEPEGTGLASWTGDRITALKSFAKAMHKPWQEVTVQLAFIEHEMAARGEIGSFKKTKTAAEAAHVFDKYYEGGTDPGGIREKYAEQAFSAHPQHHHAAQAHEEGEGSGYYESAAKKAAKKSAGAKAPKVADMSAAIDKWAEEHVGKFRESTGKNTGPELDALQKEFHTRAAAWCAEFATTAAMMGGANKAVRTASVATIREWAEAGTHGYKKGVGRTPHVGDLMMLGNEHVGFVQSVHGSNVTTIEGNTSGGKVEVEHRRASEGTYATPIYRSKGAGSVIREGESGSINERLDNAIKRAEERAEHLHLSAAQRAALHAHAERSGMDRGRAGADIGLAGSVDTYLQAQQAKWAMHKPDLTTAEGQATARSRDETVIDREKAKKAYFQLAVKELQKAAHQDDQVRKSYLKFAKHAKGRGAKKQALEKAATFAAKVETARKEAAEMGGSIAAAELAIEEGENTLNVVLPQEIAQAAETAAQAVAQGQSNDLSAYQQANSKIDLEQRAGLLTEDQAKAAKIANANKALGGGFGALSEEGRLQVLGDLKEFAAAVTNATNALEAHTKALEESAKTLREFSQISAGIAAVEAGSLAKSLADTISGQIAGVSYHGRQMTAGAGTAARY